MADDTNEDSWLYGTSNPDSTTNGEDKQPEPQAPKGDDIPPDQVDEAATEKESEVQQSPDSNQKDEEIKERDPEDEDDPAHEMEEQDQLGASEAENPKDPGDSEDDDSDDDINVVIGDIKSGPTYNIKQRTNLLAPTSSISQEKMKQSAGKFNIEEFESVGTINGVPTHEFSIDSLEEKPWRKPGADITDYFNYGFNEDTWRAYCERQKRLRMNESGVGLQGLTTSVNIMPPPGANNRTLTPLVNNDNSKYSANLNQPRKTGNFPAPAKENVIQVMTAECREYSRPGMNAPPNAFNTGEQYFEPDNYNYGYEPTQDSQWMAENPNWTPSGIKELTPGPQMVPPPMGIHHGPPLGPMRPPMGPPLGMHPPPHMGMGMMPPRHIPPAERDVHKERERERDRDRDRERERDRDRERERRGERPERSERVERGERDREREERDRVRDRERERDHDWDRDREREREHERGRERGKSEESERNNGTAPDSPSRDRERRRAERHRERDRERSSRRERSRSREKSRRRSRSRDKDRGDRKTRDKKKSHRKDKEESE